MSRDLDLLSVTEPCGPAVRIWRNDRDAVTLGMLQGHDIAIGAFVWKARDFSVTDEAQHFRLVGCFLFVQINTLPVPGFGHGSPGGARVVAGDQHSVVADPLAKQLDKSEEWYSKNGESCVG